MARGFVFIGYGFILNVLGGTAVMSVTKKWKSIAFEVRVWWNPEDQMIHLASNASKTFILTVCDDPKDALKKKARGHRKLFRELSKLLTSAGVPAP